MRRSTDKSSVSRRNFLKYGVVGITGIISAVLAVPLVRFFLSPALASSEKEWAVIARKADIPVGKPTYVEYEQRIKDAWVVSTHRKAAWVVTKDDQTFTAFDPHCTHLGCPYTWSDAAWKGEGPYKGQPHFQCPCHGGHYTIDGTVIAGPPPRPLDRLLTKIEGDNILAKEA